MIQRALASKGLVAYVLACATGMTLYFRWPFPADDLMLQLIAFRAPAIYQGFRYTYTLFLFTTPYIAYSLIFSGLYIFAFRPSRKVKPMELPPYPDPRARNDLFLVLGEVHDPRRPATCGATLLARDSRARPLHRHRYLRSDRRGQDQRLHVSLHRAAPRLQG